MVGALTPVWILQRVPLPQAPVQPRKSMIHSALRVQSLDSSLNACRRVHWMIIAEGAGGRSLLGAVYCGEKYRLTPPPASSVVQSKLLCNNFTFMIGSNVQGDFCLLPLSGASP
jgi:hypothetical protein